MGETDTADRVGGENQWVTARREAGMLECPARGVAVRGRRWRCGHAGPNIVFFFFFFFAWVGHIDLHLCDLIVHRCRPVGGALPSRMANAGRCDYKKKKKKKKILGGASGTAENSRSTLNIGYGTTWKYTWLTINLLASLIAEYVRWPAQLARRADNHRFFRRCIGFLDGSNVVLRDKPMDDPEAYFSTKKPYGFNIQAICDWDRRFIWAFMGHTASVHDSTAFKSSKLYRNAGSTSIRRNTS